MVPKVCCSLILKPDIQTHRLAALIFTRTIAETTILKTLARRPRKSHSAKLFFLRLTLIVFASTSGVTNILAPSREINGHSNKNEFLNIFTILIHAHESLRRRIYWTFDYTLLFSDCVTICPSHSSETVWDRAMWCCNGGPTNYSRAETRLVAWKRGANLWWGLR